MNKFVKTDIDKKDLVLEYITSINGFLKLTGKELQLLVELINLDINYDETSEAPKNVANTANRKYLLQKLNMTRDNLSTYIKKLRLKGLLIKDGPDKLYVRKELKPDIIRDTVQVVLILKTKNDTD